MKNYLAPAHTRNGYSGKMRVYLALDAVRWMKGILFKNEKTERKPPLFADAVSNGIRDFFEEMGCPANRKI